MKLFFDTETTGLVDWKKPDNHTLQPRLVQLGMIYTEDDGTPRMTLGVILKPYSFEIPVEASNIHGITTEVAKKHGINGGTTFWGILASMFEEANEIICHNYAFDKTIINGEFPHTNMYASKHSEYKWPKLSEAYEFLFGEPVIGAHDALTDIRATMRIYFELKRCKDKGIEPLKYQVA